MVKNKIFRAFAGICFLCLSIIQNIKAQNPSSYYEEEQHTFHAGAILGPNFTQVDGDNFAGYHKVGLNAGGVIYTNVAPNIAISLEILFSQKGSHSNQSQGSNNKVYNILHYNIGLNYAEIPLLLNIFDKNKSHVQAGFSYSQLITSSETAETLPGLPSNAFDPYPFKKNDVNLIVGGNLHLIRGLYVGLRFQYSLYSVRDNINPEFGRSGQFNNLYALRLMYLF